VKRRRRPLKRYSSPVSIAKVSAAFGFRAGIAGLGFRPLFRGLPTPRRPNPMFSVSRRESGLPSPTTLVRPTPKKQPREFSESLFDRGFSFTGASFRVNRVSGDNQPLIENCVQRPASMRSVRLRCVGLDRHLPEVVTVSNPDHPLINPTADSPALYSRGRLHSCQKNTHESEA
jgi:hypothetical protein